MPEQAGDFDAVGELLGIPFIHPAARPPQIADDDAAAKDVQRVQPGQREICLLYTSRCV